MSCVGVCEAWITQEGESALCMTSRLSWTKSWGHFAHESQHQIRVQHPFSAACFPLIAKEVERSRSAACGARPSCALWCLDRTIGGAVQELRFEGCLVRSGGSADGIAVGALRPSFIWGARRSLWRGEA